MKIIKGGNKEINDQFELDKEYAKVLKSSVEKAFVDELLKKDINYIYDVACFCWNLKQMTPSEDNEIHKNLEATVSQFELDESELLTILNLFNALPKNKSNLNRIINGYEIERFSKSNYHLTVTTISQEEYLKELEEFDADEMFEEEDNVAEYEPNPIDRSLVLIIHKLDPEENKTASNQKFKLSKKNSFAILLEEIDNKTEFKENFDEFKVELLEYLFDKLDLQFSKAPEKMSFRQFENMFDYHIIPEVFDIEYEPIFKID